MTKEKLLTVRWNNILALVMGFIPLIYVVVAFSTSLWSISSGLIGLALIGAVYWLVVEAHLTMRFAWLLNSDDPISVKRVFSSRLTTMAFWAFNAVYFIFLLPYFTPIEYSTGFIALAIIILVRLIANVYANNFLEPEQFSGFPFRIP